MRQNRRISTFVWTLLIIELLDELVFGAREAAWPLIRTDFNLTYVQIGLLLSIPGILSSLIEPALGILADTWKRRVLILGGGVVFIAALAITASSVGFLPLLLAFILLYPASGAFVSLSQAELMDSDPDRHEHNMARWTLAGSIGVALGPLALTAAVWGGLGWRGLFWGMSALALVVWLGSVRGGRAKPGMKPTAEEGGISFRQGVKNGLAALRRGEVVRWLVLLEFSNLMLDVLYGYLALYFVDVVGVTPAQAGLCVAVWTGVGLVGDALLIPLLERVRGLDYLRVSAILEMILFPVFLLIPWLPVKLVALGLLGFFNSGWYSILMGQLYHAMPNQSGTVTTLSNVFGLIGKMIPLGVGAAAQQWGLGAAIWLLLLGPVALWVGLPRRRSRILKWIMRQ